MSIRFSNGYELTFACGAGALEFDGRGWPWEWPFRWLGLLDPTAMTPVAKTLTMDPVVGNLSLLHPWTCVRLLCRDGKKGAVNAVALTNPSLPVWEKTSYRKARKKGYNLAVSVKPNNTDDAKRMAEILKPLDLPYVEANLSCPNVHKIAEGIANMLDALSACQKPLVVKLSEDQVNEEFIEATDPYAEAYHGINAAKWAKIFPGEKSPIEHYSHGQQGAVSGDFIHSLAVTRCAMLGQLTKKPRIGGGGNKNLATVKNFEAAGCSAQSFGTSFMWTPWRPNMVIRRYNQMKSEMME